jgi:hypothetical protein
MLRVSRVLHEGLVAYQTGQPRDACPYDPSEEEQFHTYRPPRRPRVPQHRPLRDAHLRVRVAIDFAAVWQRGWRLGEYLDRSCSPNTKEPHEYPC